MREPRGDGPGEGAPEDSSLATLHQKVSLGKQILKASAQLQAGGTGGRPGCLCVLSIPDKYKFMPLGSSPAPRPGASHGSL